MEVFFSISDSNTSPNKNSQVDMRWVYLIIFIILFITLSLFFRYVGNYLLYRYSIQLPSWNPTDAGLPNNPIWDIISELFGYLAALIIIDQILKSQFNTNTENEPILCQSSQISIFSFVGVLIIWIILRVILRSTGIDEFYSLMFALILFTIIKFLLGYNDPGCLYL